MKINVCDINAKQLRYFDAQNDRDHDFASSRDSFAKALDVLANVHVDLADAIDDRYYDSVCVLVAHVHYANYLAAGM